jgi:hypothetical protein
MKELTLDGLYCKEHGRHDCKRWNLNLSKQSMLSKLVLLELPGWLQLNISTPSLVYVMLWDIKLSLSGYMLNIERMELVDIEMSAGSLQNFIYALENLPQSITVEMAAIKPETEYERVRENIRRSQTFHMIRDDNWFEFKTVNNTKRRMYKLTHCTIS